VAEVPVPDVHMEDASATTLGTGVFVGVLVNVGVLVDVFV
jgi:hypothetical protein